MKLDIIAGARPNFMKIAPIIEALKKVEPLIKYRLIHTGQHYDEKMSGSCSALTLSHAWPPERAEIVQ